MKTPTAPIDVVLLPFQRFLRIEAAGGLVLLAAAVIALVWANSGWAASYESFFSTPIIVGVGEFAIDKPLILWINDGLMAIFFLFVGLEIKREILVGELSSPRKALLPAAAAIGGMVGPAICYLSINAGSDAARAWGVPMATDIAFAVGALALLGRRVPAGLKVFLVALAIVDDLGAVALVALVYTESINAYSLWLAGGVLLIIIAHNFLGVRHMLPYIGFGLILWVLVLKSGVHATIAGIALAMCIPARARLSGGAFQKQLHRTTSHLAEDDIHKSVYASEVRQSTIHDLERACSLAQAPLLRLEHALLPWVSFLIMPVFALANAGVDLSAGLTAALTSPIAIGITLGLLLGKQVGVTFCAWLMIRLGFCALPEGVTMRHVYGAACLAGIGFTMSLFIAGLAFTDPTNHGIAKVGILVSSLAAAAMGIGVLLLTPPAPPQTAP